MASDQPIICPHKPRPGAAVKATCRVLAVVFLSLLLPLSVLLLARLSIARYLLSISGDKTTWALNLLVFLVAFSALVHCLTGSNPALLIGERRRICAAWALLFLMQACLSLGIRGTIDAEINSSAEGNNWVLLKRFLFALGLHEEMIFWSENAVRPAVDGVVFGFSGEDFARRAEKLVLAAVFGNMWWRRLRKEAEALLLLPPVAADLAMNGWATAGVAGWWLYYLTAAVGAVRAVRGFVWVLTWIFKLVRVDNRNKK